MEAAKIAKRACEDVYKATGYNIMCLGVRLFAMHSVYMDVFMCPAVKYPQDTFLLVVKSMVYEICRT